MSVISYLFLLIFWQVGSFLIPGPLFLIGLWNVSSYKIFFLSSSAWSHTTPRHRPVFSSSGANLFIVAIIEGTRRWPARPSPSPCWGGVQLSYCLKHFIHFVSKVHLGSASAFKEVATDSLEKTCLFFSLQSCRPTQISYLVFFIRLQNSGLTFTLAWNGSN